MNKHDASDVPSTLIARSIPISPDLSRTESNERHCFALQRQSYITKRHQKSHIQRKIQTFHFLNKMSTNLLNTKFNTCKILLQTKVPKLYPKNAKHLPNYLFSKCAKKFTLNLRFPREASQILSSFNGNTY